MAQFKAIETVDGQILVVNRDYVVAFKPQYGDSKTSGYLALDKGASPVEGIDVSKKDGEEVHQWLLQD